MAYDRSAGAAARLSAMCSSRESAARNAEISAYDPGRNLEAVSNERLDPRLAAMAGTMAQAGADVAEGTGAAKLRYAQMSLEDRMELSGAAEAGLKAMQAAGFKFSVPSGGIRLPDTQMLRGPKGVYMAPDLSRADPETVKSLDRAARAMAPAMHDALAAGLKSRGYSYAQFDHEPSRQSAMAAPFNALAECDRNDRLNMARSMLEALAASRVCFTASEVLERERQSAPRKSGFLARLLGRDRNESPDAGRAGPEMGD